MYLLFIFLAVCLICIILYFWRLKVIAKRFVFWSLYIYRIRNAVILDDLEMGTCEYSKLPPSDVMYGAIGNIAMAFKMFFMPFSWFVTDRKTYDLVIQLGKKYKVEMGNPTEEEHDLIRSAFEK